MKHERLAISTKYNHRCALKYISKALEQTTNYSERYKWRSMSSQIIVQLCEDSLTFKKISDLGILFKQQAKQNKMPLQWSHNSCEEAKT